MLVIDRLDWWTAHLHGRGALLGGGGEAERGEAVVEELVGVADGAVGNEAADSQLLEPEELDITADGLPGADG